MTPENLRLLGEATMLPLTSWRAMDVGDGAFYAFFQSGPLLYALMMGPAKVPEGIEMATRALIGGKIIPARQTPKVAASH